MKRPPLGWRTHAKLIKEFRQGETQSRWSERRFLILMAEYRLNCRRELLDDLARENNCGLTAADFAELEQVCDHHA